MTLTGKKSWNEREIIWSANYHGSWLKFVLAWFVIVSLVFLLSGGSDGTFLVIGLTSLAALLWRNTITFDLRARRYFRRRGFFPWVKQVSEGSFSEFSFIEIAEWDTGEETYYSVILFWRETDRKSFCFGTIHGVTASSEAEQLGARLSGKLDIPIKKRWLSGTLPA